MDHPSAPCEAAGWANYFRLERASLAHAAADAHSGKRLGRWLCRKRKVKSGDFVRSLVSRLWPDDGSERLRVRTANSPRLYSFRAGLPPAGCDTLARRTKPLPLWQE